PGVAYLVELLPSGFEQYFVVKDEDALAVLPDLALDVRASTGAQIVENAIDGGISVLDSSGNEVAFMPTPRAWDAAGDEFQAHPVLDDWQIPGTDVANAAPAHVQNLLQALYAKAG